MCDLWQLTIMVSCSFIFTILCLYRSRNVIFRGVQLQVFSYLSDLIYVLGAQKNRLIETVLLSTHNIGFG